MNVYIRLQAIKRFGRGKHFALEKKCARKKNVKSNRDMIGFVEFSLFYFGKNSYK